MKALVKFEAGPGNLEIRDIPEPMAGPGQVKIEIREAGICGSDLHIYHSDIAIPVNPPVVIGHEFSGVISEIGEGVTGWKIGDRVVSETAYHYCGVCDYCREGFYNLCVERRTLGYWFNGVFTNYTVVPAGRVHRIPDNVSFTAAAMTEPLACVAHAIYDLTTIKPNDLVLVSGPGAIGLMAMQIAKAFGARVIVSGTNVDTERLEMAKSLGADYTVNVQQESLAERINALSNNYGADVVLECSGNGFAVDAAINVVKKRGWFTQIIMVSLAILLGFRGPKLGALYILFAAPTSVTSYIMARDMKSDHILSGQLVILTTLLCGFTLFIGIYLLRTLGMF